MKSPSHRRCEHPEVHAHATYSGRVPLPENPQQRHQLRCKNAPQATIGKHLLKLCVIGWPPQWSGVLMHRPFVTTVKFENDDGGALRLHYAVAAADTADAKAELERRFLDLEVDHYTIERIVEATTLQARMLKLPPRWVMLLA